MARSFFAALVSVLGLSGLPPYPASAAGMTPAERQAAADQSVDYMGRIVKVIVQSKDMQDIDWASFSLVMEFDDEGDLSGTYGYAYDAGGGFTAISVRPRLLRETVLPYRRWLDQLSDKAPEERPPGWNAKGMIKMLLQFDRRSNRVNSIFEYNDPDRWQVTPKTLDAMIAALKPKL